MESKETRRRLTPAAVPFPPSRNYQYPSFVEKIHGNKPKDQWESITWEKEPCLFQASATTGAARCLCLRTKTLYKINHTAQ